MSRLRELEFISLRNDVKAIKEFNANSLINNNLKKKKENDLFDKINKIESRIDFLSKENEKKHNEQEIKVRSLTKKLEEVEANCKHNGNPNKSKSSLLETGENEKRDLKLNQLETKVESLEKELNEVKANCCCKKNKNENNQKNSSIDELKPNQNILLQNNQTNHNNSNQLNKPSTTCTFDQELWKEEHKGILLYTNQGSTVEQINDGGYYAYTKVYGCESKMLFKIRIDQLGDSCNIFVGFRLSGGEKNKELDKDISWVYLYNGNTNSIIGGNLAYPDP